MQNFCQNQYIPGVSTGFPVAAAGRDKRLFLHPGLTKQDRTV